MKRRRKNIWNCKKIYIVYIEKLFSSKCHGKCHDVPIIHQYHSTWNPLNTKNINDKISIYSIRQTHQNQKIEAYLIFFSTFSSAIIDNNRLSCVRGSAPGASGKKVLFLRLLADLDSQFSEHYICFGEGQASGWWGLLAQPGGTPRMTSREERNLVSASGKSPPGHISKRCLHISISLSNPSF